MRQRSVAVGTELSVEPIVIWEVEVENVGVVYRSLNAADALAIALARPEDATYRPVRGLHSRSLAGFRGSRLLVSGSWTVTLLTAGDAVEIVDGRMRYVDPATQAAWVADQS